MISAVVILWIKARVRISWSRLITVTVWWNTALWSVKITIELKETWQTGLLADNPPLEWQKNHSNTGNWWKLKSPPQAKKNKENHRFLARRRRKFWEIHFKERFLTFRKSINWPTKSEKLSPQISLKSTFLNRKIAYVNYFQMTPPPPPEGGQGRVVSQKFQLIFLT